MSAKTDYNTNVFINCAFDEEFEPFFHAIVFTVHNCGFIVRCALENASSSIRLDRIFNIIKQCKYGIHDISRLEINEKSPLPRFNMPYELGVFMGSRYFGSSEQKRKEFLVLDEVAHRYKRLISDLAGYDFLPHDGDIPTLIKIVRDWLAGVSGTQIPGHLYHQERFERFLQNLPAMCVTIKQDPSKLDFQTYYALVSVWINQENENLLSDEE